MPLHRLFLLALLTLAPALPVQAQPDRVTCRTTASLTAPAAAAKTPRPAPSPTFIYDLRGTLPENAASPALNLPGSPLTLTVYWRNGQGPVQTLIRAAALTPIQPFNPIDLIQLPFDPPFRSLSDRRDPPPQRLYEMPASVNGLYVSLQPNQGQPQQIQVVHGLHPGQWLRSPVGSCQPVAADLEQRILEQVAVLQEFLQQQNWAAADRETRRLLAPDSAVQLPFEPAWNEPELIRTIDQLWLTASGGRFGLSVQLRLWQEAQAQHPQDVTAAIEALRDRVGWKIAAPRQEEDFISSDWRNEAELTYSLQAPEGHLPWVGVSDAIVQSVAVPPPEIHCGVCTVDAMQLRFERFYRYIPELMDRLSLVLP